MSLALAALALGLLGALRPEPRGRARMLLGALALGLASASLHAVGGGAGPGVLAGGDLDGNGLTFLQVVAGLVLLGIGAGWSAGWGIPLALVTVVAGVVAWPLFMTTGWLRPVGSAAGLLAVLVFGWLVVARLRPGRLLVAIDRGVLDPSGRSALRPSPGWVPTAPILAASAASLLALMVPHLWTALGGVVVAVVATGFSLRQARRPAWSMLPMAILVGAILLWSVRLSGPLGGWIPSLIDGPFSPRAAQILALLVGLAGAALAGAWPLHGVMVPVLLAPTALAVGGVFGTFLIPDGVQWFQPIFAPLALVGMLHAMAWRRVDSLLIMGGLYGLWTGTREGAVGAALLIGTGWLLAVVPGTWIGRVPIPPKVSRLAWVFPIVGVLAVQRGGIMTETTYAVLATIVAGTGLVTCADRPRLDAVAPSR